jgi:hypothetical protein
MMRAALRRRIILCLAAWLVCQAAAQETRGTIFGRILDSSGAAVPEARITAIQQETNIRIEAVSNIEGNYVLPYLNPGRYTLVVEKEGFAAVRRENIVLRTQERLSFDFTLSPGKLAESVTVTAESPMIQTATADFGQVVTTTFINRLPVVGTNPLGLADMAPGVVPQNPDGGMATYTTSYISINGSFGPGGQSGSGNQMTIDGAPAEVPRMSGVSYVIPMHEMVSEIKIVTAMFDASLGRTNGGSILIATRSGTNEYHGSAYYHFRDERFNANSWTNNYYGRPRGQLNYWLAGGTFGGPIRRDRSFFMLGTEKVRNVTTVNYQLRVPTEPERRGDFSQTLNSYLQPIQLYDPLTTVMDARGNFVSRQPFPGGRIPPDRINPVGAAVAGNHPQPNYTLFPNQLSQVNYLTSANARHPIFLWQSRVDHVLSSRHRLYFRYARNHSLVSDYDRLPVRGYSGYGTTQDGNTDDRLANQFAVEETATLRPTLVASFRLAFNRFDQKTRGDGDKQDPDALRLPEILKNNLYSGGGQRLGWPRFNVTDGPVPSVGPLFRRSVNNVGSFITSFTGYRGNHNLRWGWEYRLTRWFENQPGSAQNGLFEFAKALTRATDSSASEPVSGSGLASLLLGLPTSGSISRTPAMAVQSHYNAFYLQDDYRLTRWLTLSFGLRYDIETPFTERYDRFAFGFDPEADLGIFVPGVGQLKGGLLFVNEGGRPRRQGWVDKDNFGPRLGAAYTITPRTVVRFGWGLFYEGLTNNLSGSSASATPSAPDTFRFNTPYVGSGDGNRTVIPGVSLSNPFPNGFNPVTGKSEGIRSLLGSSITYLKPDRRLPHIQHIQFTVQRELPWSSLVELAYVGARYNGLYRDYNLNEVPDAYRTQDQATTNPFYGILPPSTSRGSSRTITANLLRVRFPQFTSVNQMLTNGPWGRYHSLQSRWEKRMTHGVQFVANYTFSKNIYFDPQSLVNDRFYKSVTDNDRTHIARLFFTADLPFGRKRAWGANWPRWLDHIAGGWAFTWVIRYTSGAPLGLSGPIGRPIPLANPRTSVPFHACLGTPAGALPPSPCLDISKVLPLQSKYDITPEPPRYSWLRGPGYMDNDAVFFKTFSLVERVSLELRAEANNVPNTPQWGNPNTDISNPRTFGQITSGGNPRTFRLTGRVKF